VGFTFISFARQMSTTVYSWRIVEINTGQETSKKGVATLNLLCCTYLQQEYGKQCSSGSGNINTTKLINL
jgi:hypothetical protein